VFGNDCRKTPLTVFSVPFVFNLSSTAHHAFHKHEARRETVVSFAVWPFGFQGLCSATAAANPAEFFLRVLRGSIVPARSTAVAGGMTG
jgi:hypothetical protein